ncbi:hypothetical protein L228DRAFT_76719 [Xylona heveae TC161]|uniref:Uncharacterized protein n=1 Tax=Xylona heveae (strain CBS 132557 / TC161) TaxID=1328760 RepID=A0A165IVN0_XYLHT|nr:hypothetical protein L228DRAFT_76719 [Xylona heveae TC161]KZF25445.1 hypothetical protein L228DRAFT_76719 [Xylona heveae TC161]
MLNSENGPGISARAGARPQQPCHSSSASFLVVHMIISTTLFSFFLIFRSGWCKSGLYNLSERNPALGALLSIGRAVVNSAQMITSPTNSLLENTGPLCIDILVEKLHHIYLVIILTFFSTVISTSS